MTSTNLIVKKNNDDEYILSIGNSTPDAAVNISIPKSQSLQIVERIADKFSLNADGTFVLDADTDEYDMIEYIHDVVKDAEITKKKKLTLVKQPVIVTIRELDFEMIRPNLESIKTNLGGSKLTVIGKPGSGKSVLIKALLYAKRHIIPVGTVISGSEDTNHFYQSLFPNSFIHEKYNKSIVENIHKRQTFAKQYLANPWAVFVMDDCMDDVKIFNDPVMIGLMKNSRHWSLMTIISTQYCLDFKPVIRTNIDGVFIFRDATTSNREKLYRNFASIIPTYTLFTQILDAITEDYTCLYIHNLSSSNNWQDCCFYLKAPLVDDFKFGCKEFWQYSDIRCK